MPSSRFDSFKNIEMAFYEKYYFPNYEYMRSIGGRLIRMRCPKNSGSIYFNKLL